ncbi:MAG: cell division protein FtsA, partial [Pseudomonadales bacterium]
FGGNIITSDIKQGCMVMEHQAELLKTKFGKAISEEASPNEIVSIPGLRNRPPKEISIKNLAHIIEARREEIIELVHTESISSGFNKKLAAGIVVTGGGSQLTNLSQLFEYMSGLDTRIGYPNEHVGKSKVDAAKSPMFATTVGLVLSGFKALDIRQARYSEAPAYKGDGKKKIKQGNKFFSNILEKTKGLLIDDFDDKIN